MKPGGSRYLVILLFFCFFLFASSNTHAQCSVCTRTAQQLGEKPAKGLNSGILYLAFMPLALIGFIGYKFYKNNREQD
jgi:hypothetical protein